MPVTRVPYSTVRTVATCPVRFLEFLLSSGFIQVERRSITLLSSLQSSHLNVACLCSRTHSNQHPHRQSSQHSDRGRDAKTQENTRHRPRDPRHQHHAPSPARLSSRLGSRSCDTAAGGARDGSDGAAARQLYDEASHQAHKPRATSDVLIVRHVPYLGPLAH